MNHSKSVKGLIMLNYLYKGTQHFMNLEMAFIKQNDDTCISHIFAPNTDCRCLLEPPK